MPGEDHQISGSAIGCHIQQHQSQYVGVEARVGVALAI